MGKLQGKIALITGASRGVGAAIAKRFIDEGAQVILTSRNVSELEIIDDYAKSKGTKTIIVPLDLAEINKIPDFAEQIRKKFDLIDILICNAGILGMAGPLTHNETDEFKNVFDINLGANFALIKYFEPLLKKSGNGKIVGVSDIMVEEKPAYFAPYIASKIAFEYMLTTYAKEVEQSGLQVNIVKLPPLATLMRRSFMPGEDISNLVKPEEVTDIFVYLASKYSHHYGKVFDLDFNPTYEIIYETC